MSPNLGQLSSGSLNSINFSKKDQTKIPQKGNFDNVMFSTQEPSKISQNNDKNDTNTYITKTAFYCFAQRTISKRFGEHFVLMVCC